MGPQLTFYLFRNGKSAVADSLDPADSKMPQENRSEIYAQSHPAPVPCSFFIAPGPIEKVCYIEAAHRQCWNSGVADTFSSDGR